MAHPHREQLKVVAEPTILVGVFVEGAYIDERDPLGELRSLAQTAGAQVVGEMLQRRAKPVGRTYLGRGKVDELAAMVNSLGAKLIVFDNDLTPAQVRNLEEATRCKIVDRSELILDIFANRATTAQAKLQVEIAQLEYTYPRLRAMWDHLGQVVGGAPVGIGTRGPGEQQLEIDRRLVMNRLGLLRRQLREIQERKTREVAQRNLDHFTVGLVGYTNAGKSTLFNKLTAGGAFADPRLFATLSTRVERWDLGGGNAVMLSDTVGFVRDLPHHLVASFRSTLEETIFAHLILIVLDVSDPQAQMQLKTVTTTLDEIGAKSQPRALVLNKIDRLRDATELSVWLNRQPDSIPVSAVTGEGLDELRQFTLRRLLGELREVQITLDLADTRGTVWLEQRMQVLDRHYEDSLAQFHVRAGKRQIEQLLAQSNRSDRVRVNGKLPHLAMEELWNPPAPAPARRIPPHERHVGEFGV